MVKLALLARALLALVEMALVEMALVEMAPALALVLLMLTQIRFLAVCYSQLQLLCSRRCRMALILPGLVCYALLRS